MWNYSFDQWIKLVSFSVHTTVKQNWASTSIMTKSAIELLVLYYSRERLNVCMWYASRNFLQVSTVQAALKGILTGINQWAKCWRKWTICSLIGVTHITLVIATAYWGSPVRPAKAGGGLPGEMLELDLYRRIIVVTVGLLNLSCE